MLGSAELGVLVMQENNISNFLLINLVATLLACTRHGVLVLASFIRSSAFNHPKFSLSQMLALGRDAV